jgi:hypothetical protein
LRYSLRIHMGEAHSRRQHRQKRLDFWGAFFPCEQMIWKVDDQNKEH